MEATPVAAPAEAPKQDISSANMATAEGVTGNKPTPPPEPKAEETKPAPKPEEKQASARFAELAKKERGLALSRMKLAEERSTFAKQQAEAVELSQTIAQAKRNPAAYLKKLYGDDWFGLLSKVYTDGSPPAELALAAVDEKIDAFKKEQAQAAEAHQRAAKEAQEKEAQQLRQRLASECKSFVDAHPDDYELIAIHNSHGLVPQLIEKEFERTGKLLTTKEASDAVESYLTKQTEKAAESKKFQAKYQPQAKRTPAATLSNDMAATTPVSKPPPRSDEERFARAVAAMEEAQRRKA